MDVSLMERSPWRAVVEGSSRSSCVVWFSAGKERIILWWNDLLWGIWNGFTAWIILIGHVFGIWGEFPFYNIARGSNWYNFGFLLGAGSPLLGLFRRG